MLLNRKQAAGAGWGTGVAPATGFLWPLPTPVKVCQGAALLAHTNPRRLTISHQAFTRAHRLYGVCLLRLYGGVSDVLKELFDGWDNDAQLEGVVSALYLLKEKSVCE